MKPIAVSLISGGMDSSTLAYMVKADGYDLVLLTFDYDQRHRKEIDYSIRIARHLEAEHHVIPMPVGQWLKGSSLTDDIPVPHGHYTAESMKATVVPNRNAIMLTQAYGIAAARKARMVSAAIHAGDHAIYPDCRPEFAIAFEEMQRVALDSEIYGVRPPRLHVPFVNITKADIVLIGHSLGVPWEDTWSCYEGGEVHCGRCGTCCERISAFNEAVIEDPTIYDPAGYEFAVGTLREKGEWGATST